MEKIKFKTTRNNKRNQLYDYVRINGEEVQSRRQLEHLRQPPVLPSPLNMAEKNMFKKIYDRASNYKGIASLSEIMRNKRK